MDCIIAGDLVPTKSNFKLFSEGNIKELLGDDLYQIWNFSDFRILNLEVPLLNEEKPIKKCGPNLSAPTSTIRGIKELNPSLVTLANNHILDHGIKGLESTVNMLDINKIAYVGVGKNIEEAQRPYIMQCLNKKIGFYCCVEHEFSYANGNKPGANPFDYLESFDAVENLKKQCDYVIVLYHGGKEHYRYPSPLLQKVCRKFADKGAGIVVCQHSHCIGCYENYNGAIIVYGQGNFIFDKNNSPYWQTSLLLKLNIENNLSIEYIPIIKVGNTIRLAKDKDYEEIISNFKLRSEEIKGDKFIENNYCKYAIEYNDYYLRSFQGFGKWVSRIDKYIFKNKILKMKFNEKRLLALENHIQCEAHRELIIQGLKGAREWKSKV